MIVWSEFSNHELSRPVGHWMWCVKVEPFAFTADRTGLPVCLICGDKLANKNYIYRVLFIQDVKRLAPDVSQAQMAL